MNCKCGAPAVAKGCCTKCYEHEKAARPDEQLIRESSEHPDVFARRWMFFLAKQREVQAMEAGLAAAHGRVFGMISRAGVMNRRRNARKLPP